jgi:hypothetical protein
MVTRRAPFAQFRMLWRPKRRPCHLRFRSTPEVRKCLGWTHQEKQSRSFPFPVWVTIQETPVSRHEKISRRGTIVWSLFRIRKVPDQDPLSPLFGGQPGRKGVQSIAPYSFRMAPTGVGSSIAGAVADRRVRGVSRLNWRILYSSAL